MKKRVISAIIMLAIVIPVSIVGGTIFEIIYEIIFYPITKALIKKIKANR